MAKKLSLNSFELGFLFLFSRDVTKEMKKALKKWEKAESRMYKMVEKRGVAGGEPPADGQLNQEGPLPDCSVSTAFREFADWKPSSPEEVAAEWYFHGMFT